MDSMPVEVIGRILSHMVSARDLARASATCRTWRAAAKHHCRKLSFHLEAFRRLDRDDDDDNDDENRHDDENRANRRSRKRMLIITEAVLQTTSLCELSISGFQVHEAPLIAWLLHTSRTLKSLRLLVSSRLRVNILEKLAYGGKVALECLVWHHAYIPNLNPAIHSLPSLVSLTLQEEAKGLHTVKDLEVLLSLFPKLEFLSLCWPCFWSFNSKEELNVPPSLKTLHLERIFLSGSYRQDFRRHFVLHADTLKSLSLVGVGADLMTVFGHSLECLHIIDFRVQRLKVGNLASLLDLKLFLSANLATDLATQVLHKASTKLRKLQILGCIEFASIGDLIASLFPCLRELSLDSYASSQKLIMLESVVALELTMSTNIDETVSHIVKFLEGFPNLKRLTLVTKYGHIMPHLNHLARSYPHVDIRCK